MTTDNSVSRPHSSQWELDAAALADLMTREIALTFPHLLDRSDSAAIKLTLLAQLRDASVLRRFLLVNADEPGFAVALAGSER
jgi:hypothetical protein